jgi:hypothetical protein
MLFRRHELSIWFEGSQRIACPFQHVKGSVADIGAHFVGVVEKMPGLSTVEIVDQGDDFVVIKTNEGTMSRSNITKAIEVDRVVLAYDETYEAGSATTVITHFVDEYTVSGADVEHRLIMSGVEASGFLGFLYRHLGKSSIGKAVLKSHREYLERTP